MQRNLKDLGQPKDLRELTRLEVALKDLATIHQPQDAEPPILAAPIRMAIRQWLTELNAEKELAEAGLKPRRSAMLDGPLVAEKQH